jgi:nitrogen fixation/metabolism regulation signal transduction histidine kinase
MTSSQIVRRKRYLIDPKFQLKYSLFFLLCGCVTATALGGVAYLFFRGAQLHIARAYIQLPPELMDYLQTQLSTMTQTLVFLLVVFSLLSLAAGILLTHRIAGPIGKFRRAMDAVTQGDQAQRLTSRQGDDFPEIADAFNAMMDSITRQNR